MAFSIIQCGSTARGDANSNSDVDMLCIWSGNTPNYTQLTQMYGDLAFYSVDTIRRMRAKGSLFLTHLDVDGIFIDGDRSLINEFRGFRPSNSQVSGLYKETAQFIVDLDWFPDSNIGELWLCDVLYVALRTCVYCKNAKSGIYTFGYLDALKACSLSDEQVATMLLLREGKYRFRNATHSSEASEFKFDSVLAQKACFAVISKRVRIHRGGVTNWTRLSRRDYWGERLVERAILNMEHKDDEFMIKMRHHSYNKRALKTDISRIVDLHT